MTTQGRGDGTSGMFGWLRHFIVGVVPLGGVYGGSALLYRQSHAPEWMWVNLAALMLMVVYLLFAMFRGTKQRAKRLASTPAWARMLFRFVDDDDWFAIIILGVSVILIGVSFLSDWLHWGGTLLWVLTAILGVTYLVYVLVLTFASGYRAMLTLMNASELQLRQTRRENDMLRRETLLASRTHDTVSSALTSIALFSEQQRDESDNPTQSGKWATVNSTALQALDNLHQVIDLLGTADTEESHSTGSADMGTATPLLTRLTHEAEREDLKLHVLGFPGSTEITGEYTGVGGEAGGEIVNLLGELYVNIRDHAATTDRYHIVIALDASQATIEQTNIAADNVTKPRSGRGLNLHRKLVRQLGGELIVIRHSNQWKLEARIPLTGPDQTR